MSTSTMNKVKIVVILFYLALFVGLALFDERPNAEMVKEMERKLPEVIDTANVWVAIVGFASPQGISPYSWGEERLRKAKDAAASKEDVVTFLNNDKKMITLSFQGERPSFNKGGNHTILEYVKTNKAEVGDLLQKNRALMNRYKSLYSYTLYIESLDFSSYTPLPLFSLVLDAVRLNVLQIAIRANQGDIVGAINEMRWDMEFWRMVSGNSTTLVSKLVSLVALNIDLGVAAELGTMRELTRKELQVIDDILRSFDRGEVSFVEPFRGESHFLYKQVKDSHLYFSSFEKLIVKQTATNNRIYLDFQEYGRLAELSAQQFSAKVRGRNSENEGTRSIGIPFLYNPVGELLAVMPQAQGFQSYIVRGHNVEGLRRLAWLKVHIKAENIPKKQIPQFLDAHASDFGNPYGGQMQWEPSKGSIFFNDLSRTKVELYL